MEEETATVRFHRARGGAERESCICMVPLPEAWLERMGVTPERREVALSFDEKRIILERASGQPMKQVPLADKKEIRRFALVWRELYKNHAAIPGYFFENIEFMGESLSDLGFVMDCGESVKRAFPGVNVFDDNEAFHRVMNQLDIQLLGNAIYSQWRYWNHWAMAPMDEDDYQWFVIALSRLAELCE